MTDRAPESLRHPLERHHRLHTRALVLRHALRAAAASAAAITLAVLIGAAVAPGVDGAWMRLLLVLAACAALVAFAARRFARSRLALDAYLEHVEGRFPAVRSWLRNALDLQGHPAPHTSPDLARALTEETERRLREVPLASLTPRIAPRRPAFAMTAAVALLVLGAVLWPGRVSRSWATLWNPSAAAPPVRLEVEPGSVRLTPGASLAVRARVWGTERAPRLLRGGPAVNAVAEGVDAGARVWRFDLTQLTRAEDYRVRVAAVESPRYRIDLSGEPSPVGFDVEYHAPAYARLPVQRGAAARGDLVALRGTRARLTVTFDRDLEQLEARLPGGSTSRWEEITPRRWRGEVAILDDGEYELHAVGDRKADTPGEGRWRYRIQAIADAPPVIAVRLPQGDLDLPAGQMIPLEVLAQDDLGLSELRLQFRKDPSAPWADLPLGTFGTRPREARVASRWDAAPLALTPGEVATFRFELYDDNAVSGRGRAVSPEFQLRFPSLAELYDKVDEHQADAQTTLEKAAEQTRELQKTLDKLQRQQPRPGGNQNPPFERSEEMKSALERQQKIGEQVEQATEQLRQSLEQAAERQAFDEQLTRKLKEMAELMQQVESKEFKDAMKKMQEALEKLDKQELDQNLPKWRQENREMLANLERTIELLKKLREEEKLQSLAQRAEELKAQQDALNREHEAKAQDESAKSKDAQAQKENEALAEQQKKAAEESEQLAKEASEAAKEMENQNDPQGQQEKKASEDLQSASEEMSKGAAPSQHEASESARKGQKPQARRAGQKASESLQRAAEKLEQLAQEMQQQQQGADLAAVRRAAQDLVSLQRSSEQNLSSEATPREKGDRQTDLSEGTSRVADSLFNLARETPFLSPKLTEALGRAINGLQSSGRDLAAGNRARGEQAGRSGSESLNEAILHLRAAEGAMCQNPGQGAPGGMTNPRRLGQVGQRQSQLNRDSQTLAQRMSQQMRLSTGDRQQLDRLAQEQARIRQQLEEIRHDEESHRELLGKLDQTQRDMQAVEEMLRQGTSDGSLEEKQNRIMSRLLDAQRSINRRDYDPERESRPGEDVARQSPAELPRELLRETDRLRLDLLKAEADRYPAQYRAFVEAYLRSLNGSRR